MSKKAVLQKMTAMLLLVFVFSCGAVSAEASIFKQGMRNSEVRMLQTNLKQLGVFSASATGYFGTITKASIIMLQKQYGLVVDGIVGPKTNALIDRLLVNKAPVSRSSAISTVYEMPWFGGVEKVLAIGDVASIYDIDTGLRFKVKRTYGYHHADCEPLTASDTAIMKKIYGGQWSWTRRAVIVTTGSHQLAASMAGMPHAGRDDQKASAYVSNRSGGYGYGANLDAVKNNQMSGVFDLHFYLSKTHGSNRVDEQHQLAVKKAADWARKNL